MASFRIISIPQGGAPEEIRKEWIGIVLPLKKLLSPDEGSYEYNLKVRRQQPRSFVTVPVRTALEKLTKKSRVAAEWFYVNLPYLWLDRDFCFGVDEVEIFESD